MTLKEKPEWGQAIRPETLVWFNRYIGDITGVEIQPFMARFTATTVDGRREETHQLVLTRHDELAKPGESNDPDSCLSIWNYVAIHQGAYRRFVHLTERGREMTAKADAYMTELKAWETDERDWKNYQMLKRKFGDADRAA